MMENKFEFNAETKARLMTVATALQHVCHNIAYESGWWNDLATGQDLRTQGWAGEPAKISIPEKLMLIVSEVSEGMEGHRKDAMDDKLPHRKMLEVELADAVIRIFDLAGGTGMDVAGAIVEKLEFNVSRSDHKPENRRAVGGKAY